MAKGYKTGGRKKGTPNKVTGTVREMIKQSIAQELESLPELLRQLEPKDRINALIKFIAYVLPKADKEEDKPTFMQQHTAFVQNVINQVKENNKKNGTNSGKAS